MNDRAKKYEFEEVVIMKRLIAMVLCLLFVISLAGCGKGNTKNLVIDYGTSSIYTKDDMDEAIDVIKKQFSSFEGCELHSLSYTSDDACNNEDNIAWMNELEEANDNKESFTQCISFDSSFRSPKNGGGAWDANEEYTWSWWLARSEGGTWKLMTWGY